GVREAREGQWLTLTPEEGRFDAILCDAGLNLLSFPTEQEALLTRLASLLTPSGRIVLRLFTAPEQAEAPEALHAAARRGEIDGFHAYKLRLAVALQAEADAGVPVAEVRRVVLARWGTLEALADAAGWSLDAVRTLELYRDKPSRMWFPTRRAWCDALPHTLTLQAVHEPGYPLGPRCPVLVLARKR
ncbi:MAG: hypothetical protein KC656_30075, partial [Myxococcales bacterium]|nr:hypothetical protein [Myxococcales bacterium]